MKATELMIGDWVVYNGDVDYINPIKIEGMDIATGMCVTTDRDDVGFDGVWPIPLTAEILEKNGFVQNGSKFTCGEISVIFTIKGFSFWTKHMINIATNNGSRINNLHKYVHELQHALRLCGINKEIII